jgi:hypothetical protein
LLSTLKAAGKNTLINYTFLAHKWQFLCYLADQKDVVLHGTDNANIQVFEPLPSNNLSEFGAQTAIYGAADGLWAMFFAILVRENWPMSTNNACIHLVDKVGAVSEPRYVFSISYSALHQKPWRKGMVYLLPGETFLKQPSLQYGLYEVRIPQPASLVPVKPFARLEVAPQEYSFLEHIRGLDDDRLGEYGQAM